MNKIFRGVDGLMLFLYLLIALFGIANIYSVDSSSGTKQFIWLLISLTVGTSTFLVRPKFFENFAGLFYLFGLCLLTGVLLFGSYVNGAKAWYRIGGFSLQPVELAKISTALMLANYVDSPNFNIKNNQSLGIAFLIIFIPIVLILLQPDVGSILVFTAYFIALYREGMTGWLFIIGFYFAILFLTSIWVPSWIVILILTLLLFLLLFLLRKKIKWNQHLNILFIIVFVLISSVISISSPFIFEHLPKHQKERILVLYEGEKKYRDTAGYNLLYSKTAIGSGGFWGKGYKQGSVTAGKFVPEQQTDYIFCTVGEEWGFVGCTLLIGLYTCLIARIYYLAETQKSAFSRVMGYSLASILFMHFLINIGMVIGLFPTVGIPLPFFSYGGSSLLGFSLFIFIFLRLNYSDKNSLI
ncbi:MULTISPECIES: M50 family metallopeptidase [unclassified Apibacter]|uniref:M50 family metallopeptidase n=1 Tax=unclassified Apibacter TaxID=2630820 RepID=UPI000CFA7D5A|nr:MULTISPECIES: M50 family metallopeptidase [unclassified Apibacter]MXP05346.1 rod shape-determining protein RodA [Apibacter sp. B3546]MXP11745.1 rod shape-determining protein RodA [Apibacter sp. B3239]PQL90254.1 rod shape-determining protein RodA [Apibacter sp. wkB309]